MSANSNNYNPEGGWKYTDWILLIILIILTFILFKYYV